MTVTRDTIATRAQVWAVLADGWTYSQWVVGNSRMRAVAADWPRPGSTLHHSVGLWPFVIDDESVVVECVPLERLVLTAKGRPLGTATIVMELADGPDGGCRVSMTELPESGLGRLIPDRLAITGIVPRNTESLWRLSCLAERRVTDERS